jgi:hypothetical protein
VKRIFEDFVPVSDDEALVTTGPALDALDRIERVQWHLRGDRVVIGQALNTLARGRYLRLGGLFDGELVYSEGHAGPHQPFVREGARYYTDDWPHVRIYRDGVVYLDHFRAMIQVANPCWGDGVMYFEARATDDPGAADAWEVWRLDPLCDEPTRVCRGANPAWWNGRLFVGEWNGRTFDYRVHPL